MKRVPLFAVAALCVAIAVTAGSTGASLASQVYAEFTSSVTVAGCAVPTTPVTIVDAGPASFDGTTTVMIQFFSPSSNMAKIYLYEDGVQTGQLGQNNATTNSPVSLARELTPSAGSHDYSVRACGGKVQAGDGIGGDLVPGFIRISNA